MDNSATVVDLEFLQRSGVEVHLDTDGFYAAIQMRQNRVRCIWTIRGEVFDYFSERLKKIAPSATFIADLMDIEYQTAYESASGVSKRQLSIANQVDKIVFVSETETLEYNSQSNSKKASTVWKQFEPKQSNLKWEDSVGLLFVGGFRHMPKLEVIEWFADQVVPELIKLGFKAPIQVVGSGLTNVQITELESKGLQLLGFVEDLDVLYLKSRIVISPLLHGAGRKGKIGEALAFGIPIVSTSVGIQGFTNLEDTGIVVADSPSEMAQAIHKLHENYDFWAKAASLGKNYCLNNLDSTAMRDAISNLISSKLQSGT
jgi:glycosyltransferase involved in cell wall biosynthesis